MIDINDMIHIELSLILQLIYKLNYETIIIIINYLLIETHKYGMKLDFSLFINNIKSICFSILYFAQNFYKSHQCPYEFKSQG